MPKPKEKISEANASPSKLGENATREIRRTSRRMRILHYIGAVAALTGGIFLGPSAHDYDGAGDVAGSAALLMGGAGAAVAAAVHSRRRGQKIVDDLYASIGGNPRAATYADVLHRQDPSAPPLQSTEPYPSDDPTSTTRPHSPITPALPGLATVFLSNEMTKLMYADPGLYPDEVWYPGSLAGVAVGGIVALISDVRIEQTAGAHEAQVENLVRQAAGHGAPEAIAAPTQPTSNS